MFERIMLYGGLWITEFRIWLAGVISPASSELGKEVEEHYMDAECEMVREMFDKFGFRHRGLIPGPMPEQQLLERVECMWEEFREFLAAAGVTIEWSVAEMKWVFWLSKPTQDIPGMADALIDLDYFTKGTAVAMGLPWGHLFNDVHLCNMDKVLGTTKRGHKVDLAKPPGWQPPRTAEILQEHGWEPSTLDDVGK